MNRKFWDAYPSIKSSEITPESVWLNRRNLMKATAAGAGLAATGETLAQPKKPQALSFSAAADGTAYKATDDLTPYEAATSYNNFYEFGTNKSDPARYADSMTTDPWEIKVGGLVNKPGKLNLEDIMNGFDLESASTVSAASKLGQWWYLGLASRYQSCSRVSTQRRKANLSSSKLYRRSEMRGTRSFTSIIDWPYREGLRMDEAMNPLTLMTVGLYGKHCPTRVGHRFV